MKKVVAWILAILLFSGCSPRTGQSEAILQLRQKITASDSCEFDTKITADFGSYTYVFRLQCAMDAQNSLRFCIAEPKTISDICGRIDIDGGEISFDDRVLGFPLLAEGELSPVSAPWIFLRGLRSGYISSTGKDGDSLKVTIDDVFDGEPLRLDVWMDGGNTPYYAEILWKNRRILSLDVENFQCV